MTHITFFSQDNEISIEATGHSGFAESGHDIVCAAISMLLQTLVAHEDQYADHSDSLMDDGYLFCYAKGGEARITLDVILTGIYLLAAEYPEYVSIERGCTLQVYPSL